MRIIAGTHKGRRLEAPDWPGLRPTSDKLRETLFNVLGASIAGARVLDGFAGTGAVGIEAISRGASHVTFVEADRRAAALIARNLERCGIRDGCAIIRADLGGTIVPPVQAPFDLVFLDPPYHVDPSDAMQVSGGWLASDGRLVLEHAKRRAVPERAGDLRCVRQVVSGDSTLSFYRRG